MPGEYTSSDTYFINTLRAFLGLCPLPCSHESATDKETPIDCQHYRLTHAGPVVFMESGFMRPHL